MILGLFAQSVIIVILFAIVIKLDARVSILEAEMGVLLCDRKEFYATWDRMKKEEVDDH